MFKRFYKETNKEEPEEYLGKEYIDKLERNDDYNSTLILSEQIENQVKLLLKEEGKITFGFKSVSDALQYTTEEIKSIEEYLLDLNQNTDHMISDVVSSLGNSQAEIIGTKDTLNNSIKKMDEVSEVFEDFFSLFDEMKSKYEEINSFAKTITGIAKETNLLSLNASIEAARAGEVGKGFAVVANEIKKLSNTTQVGARDIIELLKSMDETMKLLNDKSFKGKEVVENAAETINNSKVIFEKIASGEKEINKELYRVKEAQESNVKNIEKITNNLSNIVDRSITENETLDNLIFSVQKKSDQYLYILNHLNQIKVLRQYEENK
ncbi:MAG: methyl-accepting chemotaxis protein [Clostridium sp.]